MKAKSKILAGFVLAALIVAPVVSSAQNQDQGKGGKGGSGQQKKTPPEKPPVHARRDVVRTKNVPPRHDTNNRGSGQTGHGTYSKGDHITPVIKSTTEIRSRRTFTRSVDGRKYDNGTVLRQAMPLRETWERSYFPRGRAYYPYYQQRYQQNTVFISPFAFYYGVDIPFISRDHGYNRRPRALFIDIPIYDGNNYRGYANSNGINYFDQGDLGDREPGLMNAIDELHEAFRSGDIDSLATLTDPGSQIAIFLKGDYSYSMDSDDYLDLARDAFASTRTIQFDLTVLHKRAEGVFVVSGKNVYEDRNGRDRVVYVSYVLEDINDQWTLTQVGTAPDRIQEWN